MEPFLSIIFITFGILQIILFFKLWVMTNNIKEIKRNLLSEGVKFNSEFTNIEFTSVINHARKSIFMGDLNTAKKNLLGLKYDLLQRNSNIEGDTYMSHETRRNNDWIKQIDELLLTAEKSK